MGKGSMLCCFIVSISHYLGPRHVIHWEKISEFQGQHVLAPLLCYCILKTSLVINKVQFMQKVAANSGEVKAHMSQKGEVRAFRYGW